MKNSRRSQIINLLNDGKTETEILDVLGKEFSPNLYSTSNKQALNGTKHDLKKRDITVIGKKAPLPSKPDNLFHFMPCNELITKLRSFDSELVIERYRSKDLAGKSPSELVAWTMDKTIYRSFHHETPSLRYKQWRWHNDSELLLEKLNTINDQKTFDLFAIELGQSMVSDWGAANNRGDPSTMNIGKAMKIINLVIKHLSFSSHCHNPNLKKWLHIPWDKFTLSPLREIWQRHPIIPRSPSMGFVTNLITYQQLHLLITAITQEAGVTRIIYEFWAWDNAH